jgi:hypothetical protein
MPHRQLVIFRIGCWAAILTAMLHVAAHIKGLPPPETEHEQVIRDQMETLQIELPGGGRRALAEFMAGYSLALPLFLVTIGTVGLMLQKRALSDPVLLIAVARVFAFATIGLLIISLTHWFIVPTICIAFFALCFVLSSVRQPTA